MKTISRKDIVKEIVALVKTFKYNGIRLYIYKGFEDTNGYISIGIDEMTHKKDYLSVVGEFKTNWGTDEDRLFIECMRTRSLLAIRNALFREYGKRKFRKSLR